MKFRVMRAQGLETKRSRSSREALRQAAYERHREIVRGMRDGPRKEALLRETAVLARSSTLGGPPCHWCGQKTSLERNDSAWMLTRDHLIPRVMMRRYGGYASGFSPLVDACKRCNTHRGHEEDGHWLAYPEWMVKHDRIPPSQRLALYRHGLLAQP